MKRETPCIIACKPHYGVRTAADHSVNLPSSFPALSSRPYRSPGARAALSALALIATLSVVGWLLHYAGSMPFAVGALIMVALAAFNRPGLGLFIVPALWPIADLAPWTGQIHFTESDALLLAACAGILGHHAVSAPPRIRYRPLKHTPIGYLLLSLVAVSYLLSASRVLCPWPELSPGFWLGYDTPANALRLIKAFPLAILYCICLFIESGTSGRRAVHSVLYGLFAGLILASMAALSERLAFPGLSNFSADYRTTAPFWEAHVGGAALDGWLVLTLPVLVWLLRREDRPGVAAALLMATALVAYIVFTTFTRTTYVAALAGIAVSLILSPRQTDALPVQGGFSRLPGWLIVNAATLAACVSAFSVGGYRSLAAIAGTLACAGLACQTLRQPPAVRTVLGGVAGLAGGLAAAALSMQIPKGPYVLYALAFLGTLLVVALRRPARLVFGALAAQTVLGAWVGIHWGGAEATASSLVAAALVLSLACAQAFLPKPIWADSVQESTRFLCCIGFAAVLAVAGGSYYLKERVDAIESDIAHKTAHFHDGIALIKTDLDRWIGLGPGQFPSAYFWNLPKAQYPGNITLRTEGDDPFLQIAGPRHVQGFGELFRITQRAPSSTNGPLKVTLTARANGPTGFNVELCRKWLIYEDGCTINSVKINGDGTWGVYEFIVPGKAMGSGRWYAPRLSTLSVVAIGKTLLDVRDISIVDLTAGELIQNGRFTEGADHWFFTSDRHHLPWHAKNMWVHLWVEHGILGLVAWGILIAASLGRVALQGPHRTSAGAMAVAGIAGFLVLGMFDSLLDIPRLTVMLLVLNYLALASREVTRPHAPADQAASLPSANAHSEPKVSNT